MLFKSILFICILLVSGYASTIDKKIKINNNNLKKQSAFKKKTNKEIKKLAYEIKNEEKAYFSIKNKLEKVSNDLSFNKQKLKKALNSVQKLEEKSNQVKKNTKKTEEKLVDSIIENYSITLGKKIVHKESLTDIINKEKFDIILDDSKDKILKSNLTYFQLQNDKRKNDIKSKKLIKFIKEQEKQKVKYRELTKKLSGSLGKLKNKNIKYKKRLEQIVNKQNKLSDLLGNLKILKVKETKRLKLKILKEKLARKERLKKLALSKKSNTKYKKAPKNIKIGKNKNQHTKVKNIGSSIKGIKIASYNGKKTISPLKSYKITKKFGKYYDPIYKIELFNESISMKSKVKNAKVYSILKGKVIYAKNNAGTLGNVVIVKHSNALHTVYSQLSNIPRSLKVGKWIPKGYVIGRVNDTLVFQATKSNRYINPIKLFK
jgi:murein DD-endopeptidase MepM/ murein hydrolase activator NlpD